MRINPNTNRVQVIRCTKKTSTSAQFSSCLQETTKNTSSSSRDALKYTPEYVNACIRQKYYAALARRSKDQINAIIEVAPPGKSYASPYMQLDTYYQTWAAEHPKTLPGSVGATAENIAYLREHYSGELSAGEVMDAIDTLEKMKLISLDERDDFYGGKVLTRYGRTVEAGIVQIDMQEALDNYYPEYDEPIVHCRTLDDILDFVRERRKTQPLFSSQYRKLHGWRTDCLQPEDRELLENLSLDF